MGADDTRDQSAGQRQGAQEEVPFFQRLGGLVSTAGSRWLLPAGKRLWACCEDEDEQSREHYHASDKSSNDLSRSLR